MSDLFMQEYGKLVLNSQRVFKTLPLVKLGTQFSKVDDFLARFESMPKVFIHLHDLHTKHDS